MDMNAPTTDQGPILEADKDLCSLRQAIQWRAYGWQPLKEIEEQNLERRSKLLRPNQGSSEAFEKEQEAKFWLIEKLRTGLLKTLGIFIEYETPDEEEEITEAQEQSIEYLRQRALSIGHVDIPPYFWVQVLQKGKVDWGNGHLTCDGHKRVEIPAGIFRDFFLTQEYENVSINFGDLQRGQSLLPEENSAQGKGGFSQAKFNKWFEENLPSLRDLGENQITQRIQNEFSANVPRSIIRHKIKELGINIKRGRPKGTK